MWTLSIILLLGFQNSFLHFSIPFKHHGCILNLSQECLEKIIVEGDIVKTIDYSWCKKYLHQFWFKSCSLRNQPNYELWLTRDSFNTLSPTLASNSKRLLSASLAFSSADEKRKKKKESSVISHSLKLKCLQNVLLKSNSPILARWSAFFTSCSARVLKRVDEYL